MAPVLKTKQLLYFQRFTVGSCLLECAPFASICRFLKGRATDVQQKAAPEMGRVIPV
jgi:hypothetical protein